MGSGDYGISTITINYDDLNYWMIFRFRHPRHCGRDLLALVVPMDDDGLILQIKGLPNPAGYAHRLLRSSP